MHLLHSSRNRKDFHFADVRTHLPNTRISHCSIHPGLHCYLMGHRYHLCQRIPVYPDCQSLGFKSSREMHQSQASFIGNAVPNILTDVAILSLLVHVVWGLQATLVHRLSVIGVFLLGSLFVSNTREISCVTVSDHTNDYFSTA